VNQSGSRWPGSEGQDLTEHKLDGETVFDGRLLKVQSDTVRLPDGKTATREHIIHPGAVMILPVLPSGNLVMERQFRYPLGRDVIEFPAGKIDAGESPLESAKRELLEETGHAAARWEFMASIHVAIAYSNERIDLFMARDLTRHTAKLDEEEFLEIMEVPPSRAFEWLKAGVITDAKTVVALLMLERMTESGQGLR
jgi:ADP-ribose pyrophosphatase